MRIEAGVQFLFVKVPVCKGFFIYLLTKAGSTVTEEWLLQSLFAFLHMYFLIIGLEGVHWVQMDN